MTIKENLQDGMNALERVLNKSELKTQTNEIKEVFETSKSFKYVPNDIISGGFKTLASLDRDILSKVEGSVPQQVIKQLGVVQLDASAKASELTKQVGVDQNDLVTIAGDARLAANGFLDVVVSAPFPEALAEVIKSTTTSTSQEIKNIVNANVLSELSRDNILDNVLGDVLGNKKGLSFLSSSTILSQTNSLNRLLNKTSFGFNGLLENLVESSFGSTKGLLYTVSKKGDVVLPVATTDLKKIVELKNQNKLDQAAKLLSKYSDKSIPELKAVIAKIDNRASKVLEPTELTVDIPIQRLDDFPSLWTETLSDQQSLAAFNLTSIKSKIFSSINSMSEVQTEIANLKREVTEIIVDAQSVDTEISTELEEWHKLYLQKFNQGIEAHYYIDNSGVLYRARPLEIKGQGLYWEGLPDHSERSIMVMLEQTNDKINTKQSKTITDLFRAIFNIKPGIQVLAMHDILSSTQAPWWDVQLKVKTVFGKENIKGYDPRKMPSLTQQQISQGYVG